MKKYFISCYLPKENHAGFKAVRDSEVLFEELFYKRIFINEFKIKGREVFRKLTRGCFFFFKIIKIRKNSIIILNYPQFNKVFYYFLLGLRKYRKYHLIFLIHDIESIRTTEIKLLTEKEENKVFYEFDYLISHNEKMTQYLMKVCGVDSKKIVNLQLFDYLVKEKELDKSLRKENTVVVAGNLDINKAGYLYKLADIFKKISLNAYGPNCKQENFSGNYKGSFLPEEIPSVLSGKYGLVWDGESLDSCRGDYGNYLKYNNPHKVSLYLVSGLPVIIWKQAALADLIEKENLGIIIDNLYELEEKILSVSKEEYEVMLNNVEQYREKLKRGEFLKNAIKEIEKRIEKNSFV